MKIVNIDDLKTAYKKALEQNLIDDKRGIDLSEYAEEPAKLFNNMLDNLPVTDVLDKIRAEVLEYIDDLDIAAEICDIFDKYMTESEGLNNEL